MTNEKILEIALEQSAIDCNCRPEDFLADVHTVTISRKDDRARKYLPLPFECDMVSYGNCIVAQTSERLAGTVSDYINGRSVADAFETPNMHALDDALSGFGLKVCFMAEYFLPDVNLLREIPCDFALRILRPADFAGLYTETWENALCKKRPHLDVLAVGAYDGGNLIGLAGCSADCDSMYQIGIDVLPAYRKMGVGSALTSRLAMEILELGKVPFYCAAWCNIRSVRNALKCGFKPAWVELSARDTDFVNEMIAK